MCSPIYAIDVRKSREVKNLVKKVIVHEGLTTKHSERDVYTKSYIGLEWDLPDEVDEATICRTMIRMRTLIRQELGAPDLALKSSGELMCDELQKLSVEVDRVKDTGLQLEFIRFLDAMTKYLAANNQSLSNIREIAKVKDKFVEK